MKQQMVANFAAAVVTLIVMWAAIERGLNPLILITAGLASAFVFNAALSLWLLLVSREENVPELQITFHLSDLVTPEEVVNEFANQVFLATQFETEESNGVERRLPAMRDRGGSVRNFH